MSRAIATQSRATVLTPLTIGALVVLTVWFLWSLPRFNTIYSARWSRAQFEQLKTGDTLDVVLTNMGLPLSMNVALPGEFPKQIESPQKTDIEKYAGLSGAQLVLQYTKCRSRFGDFFLDYDVRVQDRKVTEKRSEFYHEWW